MAYTDVITLERAKTYLRIDDTQNETDSEINSMIIAACRFIEKKTNVMLSDRDKEYDVVGGFVRVYDYPINTEITEGLSKEKKNLYTTFCVPHGIDAVTLNVGYTDHNSVDEDIIELGLAIVKAMYYEQETDKTFSESLPKWAIETLNANRRFII